MEEDYMKKKILVVGIMAVFMLVAISFASAVSTQTANTTKKESPLFRIRTRRAIGERLGELKDNIKAKFIGERVFFLPFLRSVQNLSMRQRLEQKTSTVQATVCRTIAYTCCGPCVTVGCLLDNNLPVRNRLGDKTEDAPCTNGPVWCQYSEHSPYCK